MEAEALSYLDKRECELGGYDRHQATFFPRESPCEPFTVQLYIASESNRLWLGDASLEEIACQIMGCRGPSGHNVEYLLCLAGFMHECVPEVIDEHLFKLESIVWSRIGKQNLCSVAFNAEESGAAGGEPDARPGSFQFAARVPANKLRCLNI